MKAPRYRLLISTAAVLASCSSSSASPPSTCAMLYAGTWHVADTLSGTPAGACASAEKAHSATIAIDDHATMLTETNDANGSITTYAATASEQTFANGNTLCGLDASSSATDSSGTKTVSRHWSGGALEDPATWTAFASIAIKTGDGATCEADYGSKVSR